MKQVFDRDIPSVFCQAVFFLVVLASFSPSLGKERFRWTLYTQPPLGNKEVYMVHLDSVGNRWFGTQSGLVVLTQSEDWEEHNYQNTHGKLFSDSILCMEVDEYGDVWVGTTRGLSVYSNGRWTQHTYQSTQGGLPNNHVLSLSIDLKGSIWVGTQQGFAKLEEDSWQAITSKKFVSHFLENLVYRVVLGQQRPEVAEKDILVCVRGGLAYFSRGEWQVITKNNSDAALLSRRVYGALAEGENELWIATRGGVSRRSKILR